MELATDFWRLPQQTFGFAILHRQQLQTHFFYISPFILLISKKGMENCTCCVFIMDKEQHVSHSETKILLDYFLHPSFCCCPGTASHGLCGVTEEALTNAWRSSNPFPSLSLTVEGERQLTQRYSRVECEPVSFVVFQADSSRKGMKNATWHLRSWCKPPLRASRSPFCGFFSCGHRITPDQVLKGREKRKSPHMNPLFCPFRKESHRRKQIPRWVYHFLTNISFALLVKNNNNKKKTGQ